MAKQVPLPPQYSIPSNWKWTEIGELVIVKNGYPFDSKKFSAEKSDRQPLIRIRDIVRGSTETYTDEECPEEYVIHNGDILIGMDGDFNVAKWQSENALLNQRVCCIQSCSCSLLDSFLYYYLPDPLKKINDVTPSITVKHLSTKTLEKTPIPLPPLAEQQRIVDRIDGLFAKLDAARDKAQAVLDGYELRKAAILYRAFTGELTAEWRKNKGLRLDDWKHCRFCELCEIVRGGSPRPAGDSKYYNGTIPFMKVADITNVPGPYVYTTKHTIKEAGLKKTRMISPNTLLLTNSGATLGVPAICTFDTAINDGIAAFLNLNPDFILFYYYFWLGKTKELRLINMGMAQPNLNTNIIGNVEIDLPSDMEKQEIACIVDGLLSKQKQIYDMAQQAIDNIDMMKKAILGCAFRGELGTNDPAEECPEIANLRTN